MIKLGTYLVRGSELTPEERLRIIKGAGFDFVCFNMKEMLEGESVGLTPELCGRVGIDFDNVHLTGNGTHAVWADGEKGDKIVTIGNIEEKSFVLSYGKILSNDLKEFHPDEQAPNKVLCHNAYEEPGCSGAACLNKEMKIVGINIGGNTDLLGRFKSGVMIPNTQILKLIAAWASLK